MPQSEGRGALGLGRGQRVGPDAVLGGWAAEGPGIGILRRLSHDSCTQPGWESRGPAFRWGRW